MQHRKPTHRHLLRYLFLCAGSLWLVLLLGLQSGWASSTEQVILFGIVKSRPDSVTGYGAWMVEEEKPKGGGLLFTVLVDDRTTLTGAMPNVGDSVKVSGTLQGATTIIAEKLQRKNDNSSTDKLHGWVKYAPPDGRGEWVLRLRQDTTQTVLADNTTRFPQGIPGEGQAVEVRYALQNGTIYVARSIRPDHYEAQQIVVRLRAGISPATIASRYGLIHLVTLLASGNIHIFQTPENTESNFVDLLSSDVEVVWAELNYVGRVPVGNPKRVWNWGGTDPTSYINQQVFAQINAPAALAHYRGQGVTIAIIDTGADFNHEALRDHFAPDVDLWDVVEDDPVPHDEGPGYAQGHGTHIAGIIARVAPESKLLIIRALDADGRGNTAKLAYAIDWAVEHGADVINLSLGSDFDSRVLRLAIASALEKGVVIVAAAGNDNTSTRQYPASYDEVLSVTAVDAANLKADFANYSPIWVKIAAPGVGITSSVIGPQGSGYASWSGTSMSTAFVSGAAALVREKDPSAAVITVTERLRSRARDLNGANPAYAGQLGGLLDVSAALDVQPVGEGTPTVVPTATLPFIPTATPLPGTPTATPVPPEGTATPVPSITPSPSATPINNGPKHLYLSVVRGGQ